MEKQTLQFDLDTMTYRKCMKAAKVLSGVYPSISPADAEDMVHNWLMKIIREVHAGKTENYNQLLNQQTQFGWLYTCLKNEAINYLKKRARQEKIQTKKYRPQIIKANDLQVKKYLDIMLYGEKETSTPLERTALQLENLGELLAEKLKFTPMHWLIWQAKTNVNDKRNSAKRARDLIRDELGLNVTDNYVNQVWRRMKEAIKKGTTLNQLDREL